MKNPVISAIVAEKRIIAILVAVIMTAGVIAQERMQFNAVNHETNSALRYKLYPTFDDGIFLKLDTQTGHVSMLQYSANNKENKGEIYIGIPTEVYEGNEAVNGRYEVYPTANMWVFLMIDQINGNTYHIRWSDKDVKLNKLYRIN